MKTVFYIHVLSCWFMAGGIWLVQILVYPFFRFVGEKQFSQLHQFHMNRITWVVAPVMLVELVTAIWLALNLRESVFYLNLLSVVFLWLMTAFVNVPTHHKLNFDSELSKQKLVTHNWPRTILWSLRAVFLLALILSNTRQEFI